MPLFFVGSRRDFGVQLKLSTSVPWELKPWILIAIWLTKLLPLGIVFIKNTYYYTYNVLIKGNIFIIQAAHVGVGISGVEGLQAACASDYAIAQVS